MKLTTDTSNFLSGSANNAINNVAGAFTGAVAGTQDQGFASGNTPWAGKESFNSAFFPPQEIDPFRWNKLYPYRLLVVDVSKTKPVIVAGDISNNTASVSTSQIKGETGLEYIITQETLTGSWIATLPITPQQLNIKDLYAINTSATMRGIVEEHNGVKFKMLNMRATTGIWPRKPTIEGSIAAPSSLETIFAGTISAFEGVAESVERISNTFSGNHPNKTKDAQRPEETSASEFSTGYYQALYIAQFLERYVEAKKNPAYKGWRLVFDIPKQNQSFIATPISLDITQNAQKPNEIILSLQLKIWRRIDLDQEIEAAAGELPNLDANLFQRIVGTISETRKLLSRSVNLVKAVRSDFQKPFNVMRQTAFVVKDLTGLALSVADLPRQVVSDYKEAVSDAEQALTTAAGKAAQVLTGGAGASSGNVLSTVESGDTAANVSSAIKERNVINEGLPNESVASGALGSEAAQNAQTDPINDIFDNPEENFEFFDNIKLGDLELTPQQQLAIEDETERIRLLTINDFREFRQDILDLALSISNNFGSGDQTYSDIFGLPDPKVRAIDLTIRENEILNSLFEVIQMYDLLTSTKAFDDANDESPLQFVGGIANEAGIDFEDFPSKLQMPVPFGSTIEDIAARYMGDADKWIEIVTVNNLISPYIDEDGFTLQFLTNSSDRQFNIDNSDDNLFIGQKIFIQSDTVPIFVRKIADIEKISETNFLITVDGLANLNNLTTVNNARMKGFLPGTVNSQNQIYIPVSAPSDPDDRVFEIPNLDEATLTKVSKIDFLLTEKNDIALDSTGDFRLANGLTNLIQALKLKIETKKGTLLRHLDYGLGLKHGISVADIESGNIIKLLNKMIEGDSRFQEIKKVSLRLSGSTLALDMDVAITNFSGIVPVSFNLRIS